MTFLDLSQRQEKNIKALKNSKKIRQKQSRFLIEGLKSVVEAVNSAVCIDFIVLSDGFLDNNKNKIRSLLKDLNGIKIFKTSNNVFQKLSDTVTPQGIMAIAQQKQHKLQEVIKNNFLIVALDRVGDPGNMGTIIRTADAAGADAVLIGKGCVDIYNPKVVRTTMGSIFRVPIIQTDDLLKTLNKLKQAGGNIVTTFLDTQNLYYNIDLSTPTIIVLGQEDEGVSNNILDISDYVVKIPMPGNAESLNVSVACGILLFEAVKQRM